MRLYSAMCHAAAWSAAIGLTFPAGVACGGQPRQVPTGAQTRITIHDVALLPGGLLRGQILDENRRPVPDATIAIQSAGQTVADTRADANGAFAVAGLRGGVHQVVTDDGIETCRLWAPNTAPPRATGSLQIVCRQHVVVRGQYAAPPLLNSFVKNSKQWATNPFVVGGIVAAAVAIPVALHNANDNGSGS